MARLSSRRKGIGALALLASLALVVTGIGPTASAGGAADSGATSAATKKKKKRCKPGFKRITIKTKSGKKKRKCVKKPVVTTPAPVVRATITWANADSDDADLDLFAFDAAGLRAGDGVNQIPSSSLSPDIIGRNGSETFTDLAPLRVFSFGVCYTVGGSAHAPFTITYMTADGVNHTETRDPGSSFHYEFPGGAPIPDAFVTNCQAL